MGVGADHVGLWGQRRTWAFPLSDMGTIWEFSAEEWCGQTLGRKHSDCQASQRVAGNRGRDRRGGSSVTLARDNSRLDKGGDSGYGKMWAQF